MNTTQELALQALITPDSVNQKGSDEFNELTFLYESRDSFIFKGKDNFLIKILSSNHTREFCRALKQGETVRIKKV